MILLLMRHGIAEDPVDAPGGEDAARRLTKKGAERVAEMAQFLKRLKLVPTHYLSSPRIRAMQTAEVVHRTVGGRGKLVVTPTLDFDCSWPEFVEEVRKATARRSKAVVLATGHEPCCGDFLAQAVVPVHMVVPFKKGAVAAIEWEKTISNREGKLLFYAPVRLARLTG